MPLAISTRATIASALILALALGTGLALGGCGEEDSSNSGGPASIVPADAPFYLESIVNLRSEDAGGLNAALSTLLGSDDPAGDAIAMLEAELEAGGAPVGYEDDIEPLLGDRGALFFQTFPAQDADEPALPDQPSDDSDEGDGAFVVETTDDNAARDKIDAAISAGDEPAQDATYDGVDYRLDESGDAVAVFDGFVVAGTETGVKAAIDASAGDSLAESEQFSAAVEGARGDPVLLAYADVPAALEELEQSGQTDATGRAAAERALGGIADAPALMTVSADADSMSMDLSFGIADAEQRIAAGKSELLRSLPGDAWGATAIPDLGAAIEAAIESFTASAGELGPDVEGQFRRETGLELGELTGAIGDAAIFVRGTDLLDLGGAAVIEDLEPGTTADGIDVLRRQARREGDGKVVPLEVDGKGFSVESPGMAQAINVVQRDDRLVIAYGREATEDAFEPPEALGDSESFAGPAAALGDNYSVSLYLDAQPPLDLAASAGAAGDPDYARAERYLEHLDYLITGTLADADRDRVRVVLGLE